MTAENIREAGEKLRAILKDLRESPENVGARAGARFDEARCFVLWFMLTNFFVSKDEKEARATITDGPRDKGADAVLIDDELRKVFVVQAKYHQPPLASQREPASHLDLFSNLRQKMVGPPRVKWARISRTPTLSQPRNCRVRGAQLISGTMP